MGIVSRLKATITQPDVDDAHWYGVAAKEIESGQLREGLWAKALAESDFDENKARGIYV